MPTIAVNTPTANYPVTIGRGLLKNLAARCAAHTGKKLPRVFVVTSPAIWDLWGRQFAASFKEKPTVLFIPAGETHKRLRTLERLCEELAAAGADRDSLLIAFGGGIVGDVTGFLAAIYMRGIRYMQVPTTLLAQVDSSVGGKTGVNLAHGKNLAGAFNHPLAVFADIDVLGTLPPRELRAGLQESVKAGVIRVPKLFAYLEKNAAAVLRGDPTALSYVVAESVRMKADVVAIDERESGLRMILNYGHTVGHAIEAATQFKKLLHGEAVGWGMIAALRLAANRGLLTEKDAARIAALVLAYGPLPSFRAPVQKLAALTGGDKKNRGGVKRFVLPTRIGATATVTDVTEAELLRGIEDMFAVMKAAR
ncbi:MAG: 3-dehydroquinate synthase [Acidobacteriaceae bacterium]|nr:3-dehydroquinate synthase [Acidobacteriaceae bacterium]